MSKDKKQEVVFDAPFSVGDKLITTKAINGTYIGQTCFVIECTPKCVVVEFKLGPLHQQKMKVPYHAVELVMTAKKIARKEADKKKRAAE